jgi:dihydrofolate synthase / folylpolyglutamate synthase
MKTVFWPDFSGYRNIELGLERVYQLLERLENPHLKIPPTIHIAGTNGKGSTLSFLRSIFIEAGLKVHTYTSPHLVEFNERVTLANQKISDEFLSDCLTTCKNAAEIEPKIPVTFFEGITVAAFLAFSKVKADILLLEVGMGGRLDATNVLPKVLASIITPIAFDHTDFLGKTLGKIAFEKAGIIKKNCPVFIANQKKSALAAILKQAALQKSETKIFKQSFKIRKTQNGFYFIDENQKILLPNPTLIGDHQFENAALAISLALSLKDFIITENHIRNALEKTVWEARLQKISSGKFFKILPKNCELYLDGSHNSQGASTVLKFLKKNSDKKISLIFSMLKDKDCESFLRKIAPQIDNLFALEIPDEPKSLKAKDIKIICDKIGIKVEESKNFDEAFSEIIGKNNQEEEQLILVCGSLYLAGNFLTYN